MTEVEQLIAVEGHPTQLPCDVTPPKPGEQVALVLWYRQDDGGEPIYRYEIPPAVLKKANLYRKFDIIKSESSCSEFGFSYFVECHIQFDAIEPIFFVLTDQRSIIHSFHIIRN